MVVARAAGGTPAASARQELAPEGPRCYLAIVGGDPAAIAADGSHWTPRTASSHPLQEGMISIGRVKTRTSYPRVSVGALCLDLFCLPVGVQGMRLQSSGGFSPSLTLYSKSFERVLSLAR